MLLDTHILLWFLNDDSKLAATLKSLIEAEQNIYVSVVSLWEIAIKLNIQKLQLQYPFADLERLLEEQNIHIISISLADLEAYRQLPLHHRDPFDRLIISQAKNRGYSLVSQDANFKLYDVELIQTK